VEKNRKKKKEEVNEDVRENVGVAFMRPERRKK